MNSILSLPNRKIIQGGMGVYISTPFLAKKVSCLGGQGTVSGVAVERILARILQRGDVGGHYRRALAHFPFPEFSEMVLKEFYIEEGNPHGIVARPVPVYTVNPSRLLISLIVCANFAFVWLAKEGHDNPVSINYLEKIAMPHIHAITGAMLAGVDYVTMGAGIPLAIPEVMRSVAEGREVSYRIPVEGTNLTSYTMRFDPQAFFGQKLPEMQVPGFIPIIASNLLADMLMKRLPKGSVQGFVIEEPSAGGHNAPPRTRVPDGKDENGKDKLRLEYGKKDEVDYPKIGDHGLPFWIGGSYTSPEKVRYVMSLGASGIQAGSIFALCEDSGMDTNIRRSIRKLGYEGKLIVGDDMRASPTGFPFKVVKLDGTVSEQSVYDARKRICDQGALVYLYEKPGGSIGYRCPSEPATNYVAKGGKLSDTDGRCCICNGLISAAGIGNVEEPPIVTLGSDVSFLKHLMNGPDDSYDVAQALAYLNS